LTLSGPGSDTPVVVENGFLRADEMESLLAWQADSADRGDLPASGHGECDSVLRQAMPGCQVAGHKQDVLRLCRELATRAAAGLEKAYGAGVGSVVDAEIITQPEGVSCKLHSDHHTRNYDADGWLAGWSALADKPMLTMIFFLADSVGEITGDRQCVGGNIEFPYIVDKDYSTLLVEPCKGMLLAFPDHPVYAYRIHEIYENQSSFVVAWAEYVART
jgi:hypothetical protein